MPIQEIKFDKSI